MQIRVDNRIQKCPFGYYDAEGLCKKSEEEILETRKAIMMLISEKRLSEKQNPALQKCRNDVALELGDVLFALCCLSNKYKFCLEKPYLGFLRHRSTKMQKIWDTCIQKITGESRLLPSNGRSKYTGLPGGIEESYLTLLKHLESDAAILRQLVIPNEKLLERPLSEMDDEIQKVRSTILGALIAFLYDLIKLSHKDLFDLESCFVATMEKNNKRAANNYQKEPKE